MTDLPTEIERATVNARQMALSVGVWIFLYRNKSGKPVYRPIHPADSDEGLELIATFDPPERTSYEFTAPTSS